MEKWKQIQDVDPRYQVSNTGKVRTINWKNTGEVREMVIQKDKKGYARISLRVPGRKNSKTFKVHRLVAIHWIDNPENMPEVNHLNFDTMDNRVENLEWATPKTNVEHSIKNGRKTGFIDGKTRIYGMTKEDIEKLRKEYYASGMTQKQGAEHYGIKYGSFQQIVYGRSWAGVGGLEERKPKLKRLTEEQVRHIRSTYDPKKMSTQKWSEYFGVPKTTLWHIVNRTVWKHID
jgi:hypothetical protein